MGDNPTVTSSVLARRGLALPGPGRESRCARSNRKAGSVPLGRPRRLTLDWSRQHGPRLMQTSLPQMSQPARGLRANISSFAMWPGWLRHGVNGGQFVAKAIFEGATAIKTDPEMITLARQLIDRQTTTYDPSDIEDRYETRLRALIDAKLKGEGIQDEEPRSVMAALRKSLGEGSAKPAKPSNALAKAEAAPSAKTPKKSAPLLRRLRSRRASGLKRRVPRFRRSPIGGDERGDCLLRSRPHNGFRGR